MDTLGLHVCRIVFPCKGTKGPGSFHREAKSTSLITLVLSNSGVLDS